MQSVDSRSVQALLIVLSITAGSTDVISFLGLNGLFTSHVTGNLAILAAHVMAGKHAEAAHVLAVPVFICVVVLTRLLARWLESTKRAPLRPLLVLQSVLLFGFLLLSVIAGPHIIPTSLIMIIAGMLGVSAMAVQNTLVLVSFKGAFPTAVMTGNVTRFGVAVGELLFSGDQPNLDHRRKEAAGILQTILGFAAGCALGAICQSSFGLWSLLMPAALSLVALAMAFAVVLDHSS